MAEQTIGADGRNWILELIQADSLWMAVGTGTTEPADGDTTLEGELVRVAVTITPTIVSASSIALDAYFPSAYVASQTIKKIGLFTAASSGRLCGQKAVNQTVPAGQGCIGSISIPISSL